MGGGALKENVLLYVMTVGWLDQSKALSTQRGPCVRTCVCVCVCMKVCDVSVSTPPTLVHLEQRREDSVRTVFCSQFQFQIS